MISLTYDPKFSPNPSPELYGKLTKKPTQGSSPFSFHPRLSRDNPQHRKKIQARITSPNQIPQRKKTITKMSKVVDDVKAGLKGIRGAGEAVRGGAMEATDELLDANPGHPEARASETKNQAIKEKGKQQLASADSTIGHHHGTRSKTAATRSGGGVPPPAGGGAL